MRKRIVLQAGKFFRVVHICALIAGVLVSVGAAQTKESASQQTKYPFKVKVTGHGRPMILIPGLGSSGEVWDSTVARYKSRYKCHVLTLAGFAGQPPITPPSIEKVLSGLADYIRQKRLNKPVVVGHSLGGFLTLWLASKEPDLVGPLVIVDSLPFLAAAQQPNATAESMKPQAEAMRKGILAAQTPEQREQSVKAILQTMITDPANIALAEKWSLASDLNTVAEGMYALYTIDLRPDLAKIQAPALVIGTWVGLRQYATREQVEETFRSQYATLPHYKLVMSDTAKHFVMFDDPGLLFAEMDSFLALKSKAIKR